MNDNYFSELADLFVALSDKTRLRLLSLMAGGEVSVGYLADSIGESQPKVSRHLAFLRNAGIVSTRRDGKWVYYAIDVEAGSRMAGVLQAALGTMYRETGSGFLECNAIVQELKTDVGENISSQAYMNEEEKDEIEIFLL